VPLVSQEEEADLAPTSNHGELIETNCLFRIVGPEYAGLAACMSAFAEGLARHKCAAKEMKPAAARLRILVQ
jgi:hypothetical protein